MAFVFAFRESGAAPSIVDLLFKDTETLTKGDLVNLETGEVDLLATADSNALGVVLETVAGTDSTTRIKVIIDEDAVYSVTDNTARLLGATLDVSGATGAQTVATSSNKEFVCARESSATAPTLVRFNTAKHVFNKAQ
mgnify:FL=1